MTVDEYNKWPKCAVPACKKKSCLRLNSKYCWPHSVGSLQEVLDALKAEKEIEQLESKKS